MKITINPKMLAGKAGERSLFKGLDLRASLSKLSSDKVALADFAILAESGKAGKIEGNRSTACNFGLALGFFESESQGKVFCSNAYNSNHLRDSITRFGFIFDCVTVRNEKEASGKASEGYIGFTLCPPEKFPATRFCLTGKNVL